MKLLLKVRKLASFPSVSPVRFGNAGYTAPAAAGNKRDLSRYTEGTRVRHTRFGDGVIVAVRGTGNNLIVTVRFEKAGNKDLAAALAPMEIIDGE